MKEEAKEDVRKFNELRNNIDDLWKNIEKDNGELLKGKSGEEFLAALQNATNLVNNISGYYDGLDNQLKKMECDYSNLKDKKTKEVLKLKKKELDLVAEQMKDLVEKPVLRNLFLEVTLRCNAKCEHCGSSCGYSIPKDEIEAEELKKVFKEISEHYDPEMVLLTVTGGEPLMRKDLFDIMEYAVGLGFHWGMATNAMLMTENTIKKLEKTNFESISISLDGLKETHESFRKVPGSFDRVLKSIEMLKGLKCLKHLQVTTVANKKNINELEDIYKLLLEHGVKEWRVMNVDPIGRANLNDGILLDKEGLTYLFDFIREKRNEGKMVVDFSCSHYLGLKYETDLRPWGFNCGAGLYIASILSNGDICVCPNARNKMLIQGNIRKDSFVDVWENKFEIFRKKRLTTNEKCRKCKSFKYCRGDSFHTWNYEENMPNMCMKELLGENFIE